MCPGDEAGDDAADRKTPYRRQDSPLSTQWSRLGTLSGKEAEEAWQWFVGRYRPFVRGILVGILGSRRLVDPAEEEFWGYVWMSGALQRADRNRRFRPFLSGIVRNFARAFGRKRGVRIVADDRVDATPARETEELSGWLHNVVDNALTALHHESPKMARALTEFYGLGPGGVQHAASSAAEIAGGLATTTQAVYMLLFRGRNRMRELVEEELREGCGDEVSFGEEVQLLLGIAKAELPGLLGGGPPAD